jgi:hypothetical protein
MHNELSSTAQAFLVRSVPAATCFQRVCIQNWRFESAGKDWAACSTMFSPIPFAQFSEGAKTSSHMPKFGQCMSSSAQAAFLRTVLAPLQKDTASGSKPIFKLKLPLSVMATRQNVSSPHMGFFNFGSLSPHEEVSYDRQKSQTIVPFLFPCSFLSDLVQDLLVHLFCGNTFGALFPAAAHFLI